MSDPLKTAEIEDVLSSIRRLVSADARPSSDESSNAAQPSDKLLLTPSLRVAAKEEDPSHISTEVTEATEKTEDQQPVPEEQSHDDMASPEAGQKDALDAERDLKSDSSSEMADDEETVDEAPSGLEVEPEKAPEEVAEDIEELSETAAPDGDEEALSLEPFQEDTPDAELEAPVQAFIGETEEEYAETLEDSAPEEADSPDAEGNSDTDNVPADASAEEPNPPEEQTDEEPGNLSAHAADIEKALAQSNDQWEPDGSGNEDVSLDSPEHAPWADPVVQAATVSQGMDGPQTDSNIKNAFAAGADLLEDRDEEVLDEDALRDLVSEIVRQELQGALGERITRNVRKLVRREIARAMAAQELE